MVSEAFFFFFLRNYETSTCTVENNKKESKKKEKMKLPITLSPIRNIIAVLEYLLLMFCLCTCSQQLDNTQYVNYISIPFNIVS